MRDEILIAKVCCALGASVAVAGTVTGAEDEGLVADPYRAIGVEWPKHAVKGRDYWYMLNTPMFGIPGIKDEPFVAEAGVNDFVVRTRSTGGSRFISIANVVCLDADGRSVPFAAQAKPTDARTVLQGVEALADGDSTTVFTATGTLIDPRQRYKTIRVGFKIAAERPFSTVRLEPGPSVSGRIGKAFAKGWNATGDGTNGVWTLSSSTAVNELVLGVDSEEYRFITLGLNADAKLRERFANAPFNVYALDRGIWGIDADQVDLSGARSYQSEFPETFIGSIFSEWDSMMLYMLGRPTSGRFQTMAAFGQIPCDKAGMRENFRKFWNLSRGQKGPMIFGESGGATLETFSCEWGAALSRLELTGDVPSNPFRNQMMYVRGAARQFNVPLGFYMAYFRDCYTPDSRARDPNAAAGGEMWGPDWGQEISLGRRELYAGYYFGANYQCFEAMPWGQVVKNGDGTYGLTGNGRSLKDFYDFYKSGRGVRGEAYAPILLLTDRYAGHDLMSKDRHSEINGFGAYYGSYPPTDADFMTEYVLRSISPCPSAAGNKGSPDRSSNFKNSTLADVFDLHVANPDTPGRELTLAQLERYPVAFLLDDLHWNENLANTVKKFVARGGTLVLTTAQVGPFADDAAFLGARILPEKPESDDGLALDRVAPTADARVVEKTSKGFPLVVRNRVGEGSVVLIASPFCRRTADRTETPVQVTHLLERLQAEVLPFSIDGVCHAIPTRRADGTWCVLVMNNAGVCKKPNASEDEFFPEQTAKIRLTLPKGATATEVRYGTPSVAEPRADGRTDYAYSIPPGDLIVLELKGVAAKGRGAVDIPCTPVKPFAEAPYVAKTPDDGFLFDPAKCGGLVPSPEVIGCWRAADGWKDSSGRNCHLTLNHCTITPEGLCCNHPLSSAFVRMPNIKFDIPEGTEEVWATPSAADLAAPAKELRIVVGRGDQRTGPDFGAGVKGGRWCAYLEGGRQKPDRYLLGPKATGKKTHLVLSVKDGFIHFFVDGEEVVDENGPLRLGGDGQLFDSFHRHFSIILGARFNLREGPRFTGPIGDLTIFGKSLNKQQIKERNKAK